VRIAHGQQRGDDLTQGTHGHQIRKGLVAAQFLQAEPVEPQRQADQGEDGDRKGRPPRRIQGGKRRNPGPRLGSGSLARPDHHGPSSQPQDRQRPHQGCERHDQANAHRWRHVTQAHDVRPGCQRDGHQRIVRRQDLRWLTVHGGAPARAQQPWREPLADHQIAGRGRPGGELEFGGREARDLHVLRGGRGGLVGGLVCGWWSFQHDRMRRVQRRVAQGRQGRGCIRHAAHVMHQPRARMGRLVAV